MQKLSNFLKKSADIISQETAASVTLLVKDFEAISIEPSKESHE